MVRHRDVATDHRQAWPEWGLMRAPEMRQRNTGDWWRFGFVPGVAFLVFLSLGPISATRAGQESGDNTTADSSNLAGEALSPAQRDTCLTRLGVDRWHHAGQRGGGVKIAILDSGF